MLTELLLITLFVVLVAGMVWSHQHMQEERENNYINEGRLIQNAAELAMRARSSRDPFMAFTDASKAVHILETLTYHRSADQVEKATGMPVRKSLISYQEQREKLKRRLAELHPNLVAPEMVHAVHQVEEEPSDVSEEEDEEEEDDW